MRLDQSVQHAGVGSIAGAGEGVALHIIGRHIVRLSIVAILEAMLEVAQEDVRGRQFGSGGARPRPPRAPRGKPRPRPPRPPGGFSTPPPHPHAPPHELPLARTAPAPPR